MPANASEIQATAAGHELNEPEMCSYRCVDSTDGSHLKLGKWAEVSPNNMTKPECDIFEVYCSRNEKETYKYLHGQIIPKTSSPIKPPENAPDVHIILIDGVSFQHLLRALPMTVNYLRTEMEATMFKNFNKVGLNSRPNFYAFLLGERAEDMEPSPWGPKEYMPGRDQEICKKYLEEEHFAFVDYQMIGYRSMWAEDWWDATPRWPNCWGFKDKPVDHFLQSYALRAWQNNTEKLWERVFNWSCRESYDYVLDILEDFVNKYQNKPKISLSWMTNDNANVLYHTDQHYLDFFKRMNKKLANSFVFFMSDHGNRYLLPTSTNIGEVEISNPFLALVLPEKLRKNKDLVNQLYKNSNELMTHFDIYATFLEIASNGSEWTDKTKFSDKKYLALNRTLKGSSLLHPLDYSRNCESLEIPFQYCLCRHEYKEFQDSTIALAIAEAVVSRMNADLKASSVASKCVELSVNKTATSILPLREFESQDDEKRIFRASIRTLPSNGQHDAFAEYDKSGVVTLISTRFGRNDSYKKQAHCIPEQFLKNYCYCKEQLPEEKKS
ncbi:hypothetical protein M3Y97_00496300 [Aphelenchoides bicaudatus]|nr:hypothetical protein M3Y97_00496300 [Aphelenchoides bicaudatus]